MLLPLFALQAYGWTWIENASFATAFNSALLQYKEGAVADPGIIPTTTPLYADSLSKWYAGESVPGSAMSTLHLCTLTRCLPPVPAGSPNEVLPAEMLQLHGRCACASHLRCALLLPDPFCQPCLCYHWRRHHQLGHCGRSHCLRGDLYIALCEWREAGGGMGRHGC